VHVHGRVALQQLQVVRKVALQQRNNSCNHIYLSLHTSGSEALQGHSVAGIKIRDMLGVYTFEPLQTLHGMVPQAGGTLRCARLQQLVAHVEQHGRAHAQQAVGAPARVRKQRVPEPHLPLTAPALTACGHGRNLPSPGAAGQRCRPPRRSRTARPQSATAERHMAGHAPGTSLEQIGRACSTPARDGRWGRPGCARGKLGRGVRARMPGPGRGTPHRGGPLAGCAKGKSGRSARARMQASGRAGAPRPGRGTPASAAA